MECKLCGCKDIELFHKGVRDNKKIDVFRCSQCGLLQLSDFVHYDRHFYENELMHYNQYNAYEDKIEKESYESWIAGTYDDDMRRVHSLKDICEGKEVLDFGCGNGGFLRSIKLFAASVGGVELDLTARNKLNDEGISVMPSIEDTGKKWDIITMFQVIEHLECPKEWIKKIHSFLKNDGILIIETPNAEDALISLYQNDAFKDFTFWSAHLMLYNSDNLERLMNDNGFLTMNKGQIQRYSLSNHLYWLSRNKPGGHEKWIDFNETELNHIYEEVLRKSNRCDTLFAIYKKIEINKDII